MTHRLLLALAITALSITGAAFDTALPTVAGKPAVAVINGEPITLEAFLRQLEPQDVPKGIKEGKADRKARELLHRLIIIKLIVQEGKKMGLAELPEIQKQVEVTSRTTLREVLMEMHVKDVKPDEQKVDLAFKDLVREWKTSSILFEKEDAAKAAGEEMQKTAKFDEIAARLVAKGSAKTEGDKDYHAKKDYLPQIVDALSKMQVGQVSPVIPIQAGFVIVRVTDIRYPENPQARAQAYQTVLRQKQQAALQAYEKVLRAKYVTEHKTVLDAVDYEAKQPGFEALLKDKRVLADIKGEKPVTVGDLTDYLRMQFFHGPDQAAQGKRLNTRKAEAFNAMLGRRVFNMEALKLGVGKTETFNMRVKEYKEGLIFDTFVQKVIVPEVKIKEEEIKAYFNDHIKEYSEPEMMKIRGLAFGKRGAAESAVEKLRSGTDFNWLAANADGQLGKDAPGILNFDGQLLTTDSMPEGVQKAVSRSKAGEFRLYASPEGHFYALAVQQVVPANPKPYEEMREEIGKKIINEKLKKAVEDYAGKLRSLSIVEVYLKESK